LGLNVAKMVDVWRNPHKDAFDRTTVGLKAGLSALSTIFAGTTLAQPGPTPPPWLSQGTELTGTAGVVLSLATGLRDGKSHHELMLATLPKEYTPIRLVVDFGRLVAMATSNDPKYDDVQVVPRPPWAGVPSDVALKYQQLTESHQKWAELSRELGLRK
jgi:hypothetical protein